MKKLLIFLFVITLISGLTYGCGIKEEQSGAASYGDSIESRNESNSGETKDNNSPENKIFNGVVLSNDSGLLIAPDKDSEEFKSSDKIAVNTNGADIYSENGEKIAITDIKAGDLVEISYNGMIMESYPAQISCNSLQRKEETTLIQAYLALIDDIYKEDPGLNGDISIIALDTTEMTNLTEAEKGRLLAKVGIQYGLEVKEGTFDSLSEEGLINKEELYFEKGILIEIKNPVYKEKSKKLTCGYQKWRSGLGAIGSDNVTVKYKEGSWVITKKGSWIS